MSEKRNFHPPLVPAQMEWMKVMGKKDKQAANKAAKSNRWGYIGKKLERIKNLRWGILPAKKKGKYQKILERRIQSEQQKSSTARWQLRRWLWPPLGKYAEVAAKAKRQISLRDFQIVGLRAKKALFGILVYEVPDEGNITKTDVLTAELHRVLHKGVRILRPYKKVEISLTDFYDSIIKSKILEALSLFGECVSANVKLGGEC